MCHQWLVNEQFHKGGKRSVTVDLICRNHQIWLYLASNVSTNCLLPCTVNKKIVCSFMCVYASVKVEKEDYWLVTDDMKSNTVSVITNNDTLTFLILLDVILNALTSCEKKKNLIIIMNFSCHRWLVNKSVFTLSQ